MSDIFFEKHDLSIGVFVVGIAVIMFLMFGAGAIGPLLFHAIETLFGKLTNEEFGILFASSIVIMTLSIVIPNVLIIRGRPRAVKINKINVYFQLICYLLFLLVLEHQKNWIFLCFVIFPLLANWLMSSAKYLTFLAFYETLRKDPIVFRQSLAKRIFK
ncbi:hypothetical protein G3444_12690 [Shewanella baltica]|uniref:hypothetical protein n=1 Tax=Shewanella baltica TaxID=62322 RepID=UPI00217D580B|nr:hypothetical protein [Shewanella baltica]MCS6119755.1 hypothetical protein [Shewanella baltica]